MAKLAWKNPAPAPVAANPIAAAIDELAQVRADAKKLEKREEALKEILKGLAEGDHPGLKVALQVSLGSRKGLDTKALKAEMPTVYDQFEKETPTRTLTIKPLIS